MGIVLSKFNQEITNELLLNAQNVLKKCNIKNQNIKVVSVAGAVEIPFALQKLAQSKKYDFLIALSCIIRGETPHFDYVCNMIQQGVLRVMLDESIPIGFGVLTMNNLKQAKARYHVGGEAALAALELAVTKY